MLKTQPYSAIFKVCANNAYDFVTLYKAFSSYFLYTGLVFHYATLQESVLWPFHIVIVFWGAKFPFHAKSLQRKGYFRYIHVIAVMTALVLPLMTSAAILSTGGSVIASFPPFGCAAKNGKATFYTNVLPASIIHAFGISLLVLIFQVVIHVTTKQAKQQRNQKQTKVHHLKK